VAVLVLILLALVDQVAAVQAHRAQIMQHQGQPIAVVAVVVQAATPLLGIQVLEALALLLFVTQIHCQRQHQQQGRPQLPLLADTVFISGILLVQSHSEAQHESFCKSRKRHRYTSYCGRARRY
jgi:hypothetical protein